MEVPAAGGGERRAKITLFAGRHSASGRKPESLKKRSQPISRVLSWAIIHLGCASPRTSSDLPGSHVWATRAAQIRRPVPPAPLFGLAPGGVCRAAECCHRRGALLPHPFTLTGPLCRGLRRFAFCCTFRGLAPPRRYLAPCPGSPDFPPRLRAAIAWLTPARMVRAGHAGSKGKLAFVRSGRPSNRGFGSRPD